MTNLQKREAEQPTDVLQQTIRQAQQAEKEVVLDEAETRRLIDAQLRAAGWEVDSEQLTYANGTRPQKGRMRAIASIIDELLAKLQRKKRSLSDDSKEAIETLAGMPVEGMVSHLHESSLCEAAQWLRERREIAQMLDRRDGGMQAVLISRHEDVLRSVERGYGDAERPQDYLEGFSAFLRENLNKIPALLVVTQRPRDLTRAQLKELRLLLDAAGFSETNLQVAWREMTNEDIAASIIGFVRQAALGDALVPYGERVDKAMKKILASRSWTAPQRKWLERIGQQLKTEVIVDRDAFDRGAFKAQGGFTRINKAFDGKLEEILVEINNSLWSSAG